MAGKIRKAPAQLAKQLRATSNADFIAEVAKDSPTFKGYMSPGTQGRLTQEGVSMISNNPNQRDEFWGTLLRITFQSLEVARAVNGFSETGLVAYWENPYSEYTQRYYVGAVNNINPQFRNLENGKSVDPYVINKPEIDEAFAKANYDRQSLITIMETDAKRILLEEGQIGALLAGVLEGINTGMTIQDSVAIKEAINQALNDKNHPLQATQNITVDWGNSNEETTDAQLTDFLLAISNIFGAMFAVDNPATGLFNAAGWKTRVEKDQYVMFARTGIKNNINKRLLAGTFNPQYLNLDLGNIYDINDFGGKVPYADAEHTTRLYPIFKPLGDTTDYFINETNAASAVSAGQLEKKAITTTTETVIGYQMKQPTQVLDPATISGAVSATDVFWEDPNDDILAVIFQKGALGFNMQNGLETRQLPNPAGLYMNTWASQPNNSIFYDWHRNIIVIRKKTQA